MILKTQFKKVVSLLLSVFVVLAMIQIPIAGADPVMADGEYSINLKVVKENTADEKSVMDDYVTKPAKLVVKNSKKTVYLLLKNSDWTKSLQVKKNGSYVDTVNVTPDIFLSNNGFFDVYKRVVKFDVEDLSANLDAYTHVTIPPQVIANYDNYYSVQIKFDTSSIAVWNDKGQLSSLVTQTQSKLDAAVEGSYNGQYSATAKTQLQAAIQLAQLTSTNAVATQQEADAAVTALQSAVTAFQAAVITNNPEPQAIADGVYSIDFATLHATKEQASSMEKYFVKPAKLTVQQGKRKVSFALNDSKVIPSFKVEQNGQLVETTIVSSDTAANSRVVEFEVKELATILNARVHISTSLPNGTPYEMDHDIRIKLDPSSLVTFIADGQYSIDFATLHATKEQASSMEKYFVKPGILTVQQGKRKVSFALNDSKVIPSFKVEQNGHLVETTIVSSDTAANSRVVEFEVKELATILNARVHISTSLPNGTPYEMDHDIRIKLDPSSLVTFIADGQYNIDFATLHATKEQASSMEKYFVKPGKLTVQQGKRKMSFALNDSKVIPSFKVEQNGQLVETTIVSSDPVANSRVVEFEVKELTTVLNARVHISTSLPNGTPYEMDHDIRIKLDPSSLVNAITSAELNGAATVKSGEQLNLTFKLNGVTQSVYQQVYRQELTVTFDPSKLDFITAAPLINGFNIVGKQVVSPGQIHISAQTDSLGVPANNSFFTLAFLAKSVSEASYTAISLNSITIANSQGNVLNIANATHSVNVLPAQVVDPGNVNKAELLQFITQAQSALSLAVEGSLNGQYPSGAKNTLQTAINQAQLTVNLTTATQLQVNQAVSALQAAISVFKASVNTSNPGTIDPNSLANGEYGIRFTVLKDASEEVSVMDGYSTKPAKLEVKDGKKIVYLTLINSDWIQFFQVQKDGNYVDAEVVSPNTLVNNVMQRVVKFEVQDWTTKLNVYTHVKIPDGVLPFPYDNQYVVQYKFDPNSIFSVNVTPPAETMKDGDYTFDFVVKSGDNTGSPLSSYLDPGKMKVENGKHILSFKLKNGTKITKLQAQKADGTTQDLLPRTVAKNAGMVRVLSADQTVSSTEVQYEVEDLSATYLVDLSVTNGEVTESRTYQIALGNIAAVTDTTTPPVVIPGDGQGSGSYVSPLKEGKYSINFRVLKNNTEEKSVMQDYVITPGVLSVESGRQYVSIKLKQSKQVTDFKVNQNGSLTDVSVISSDEKANTRVVQFEVGDLSQKVNGWVKIVWPEINYLHDYDVQIAFDKSSISSISDSGMDAGGVTAKIDAMKDGSYNLGFTVLQYKNNLKSKMNDEIKHPGTLTIKDKKKLVSLTLTKSKETTEFKTTVNGQLVDADVVSINAEENSRVVQFEVKDLSATLHAWVKQVGTDLSEESFDVDLEFDVESIGKDPEADKAVENEADSTGPKVELAGLKDIQNHWAKASIERAVALGIVNGYEDGNFRPNGEISRAEFTVMISRALKLEGKAADLSFADNDKIPSWVKPIVAQAVGAGIISSYEDNTFRADGKISRSEIAVMIVRAMKISSDSNTKLSFADADQVPEWAKTYVASAFKLGIINGRENNLFAPNASATRAEAVTLILAMLNNTK